MRSAGSTLSRTSLFLCGGLLLVAAGGCGPGVLDRSAEDEQVWYGSSQRIRGFDPARVGDVASARAIARIYEGLLQYAYLERPYRVEPLLAQKLPATSGEGLVYTFKIRPDIYFQDDPCFEATGGVGRELRASDFVYSIQRIADLKNHSSGYWAFNDRIKGLNAWRETTGGTDPSNYDMEVEGLRAVDRYTVQITLTRPYPQLLWVLAMHYSFAVPREAVEFYGDDFLNHPVGTGPYILKDWRKNYRVEFVRNPKWAETQREEIYPSSSDLADRDAGRLDDAGKSLPFIDRIVDFVVQDPSTQWLMFLTGQFGVSGISRDKMDSVLTDHMTLTEDLVHRGVTMSSSPTMLIRYTGFNMDDPVVGPNLKLRQALSHAFNTDTWLDFFHHRVVRAHGPIPPGVAGSVDAPPAYPFDLERARGLLAEAGYPEGIDPATGKRLKLTLELGVAESAEMRMSVELLISFFREIGVDVEADYHNRATFFDRLDRRQPQMYQLSWVADYPDAENFLQLFYGPNSSPGPNHSNYSNPKVDALYEQIRVMPDSAERTELCRKMSDEIVADPPWIFGAIPLDYTLQHEWVRNYKHHDFPYGMEKYWRAETQAAP